jgi:hypothetical protein
MNAKTFLSTMVILQAGAAWAQPPVLLPPLPQQEPPVLLAPSQFASQSDASILAPVDPPPPAWLGGKTIVEPPKPPGLLGGKTVEAPKQPARLGGKTTVEGLKPLTLVNTQTIVETPKKSGWLGERPSVETLIPLSQTRSGKITKVEHQDPPPPPEQPKPVPTLEELAKSVEALSKNLTVVTGDEQIKLVLGGVISADFYYNHARPVAPGIPFFLTPASPSGFSQDTFDANARATTIFLMGTGPQVGPFESGGLIALCLFNDALVVDRYGILPIQAYLQLKNEDWRIAAGLQFDIFNPLNPNSLNFAYLAGSGNAGMGFPGQARLERFIHLDNDTQVTLTVGISEALPTTVSNTLQISEDNGMPNLEGRASITMGPLQGEGLQAKRALEAGISGVVGQIRTTQVTTRVVSDVWGLGSDARWYINPCFGVQGEVFVGQTLGNYTAGVLQNVNNRTFEGIHTSGGWFEVFYYLCPDKLHTHVGYGIDDPLDGDLGPGQVTRNETYYANLIYDMTKHLRLGCELTYRRTAYTGARNNEGFGVQTQMQWRF